MNPDHVRKQIDEALEQLMQQLERGCSEQMLHYLSAMAKFHRYSWGNVLLVMAQRPNASRVAGYQTWRKLGRQVKRGEKGIAILAPIVYRVRFRDDEEDQTARPPDSVVGFKPAFVFDITQTEGNLLPEATHVRGNAGQVLLQLKSFIETLGIEITYSRFYGPVEGVSSGGRIHIQAGMPEAREFSVLVHELVHELTHQKEELKLSKGVRELEAESVAYVVCEAMGLDTNTSSSDYIKLYDGKRDTLVGSLERIQQTATRIIEGVHSQAAVENNGVAGMESPFAIRQAA